MPNQALLDLMANYPHWISFQSMTNCYLEGHTDDPYLIGQEELEIDDVPVDPSIENIRYKLSMLDNHLYFEGTYYIFSKTSFDTSRVNISLTDFIENPALDYIFASSTNITTLGTLSIETD